MELIGDVAEDLGENVGVVVIPTEVQAEEVVDTKEIVSDEDIADENILPKEESSAVVESNLANFT